MKKTKLMLGDNIESLKKLPDNSIDSIVTDPPYALTSIKKRFGKEGSAPAQFGTDGAFQRASKGFMGKEWDAEVPTVEFWREVYRVLKPGGHILSFGGTRTYHRMAVNIEDAGFEIRDQIMWLYGSGFPKSHNIGKAVDKIEGNEREVVGDNPNHRKTTGLLELGFQDGKESSTLTKGNSKWEGYGTALKPANEPICVARKPLSEKSVAENVLKWGTGGINIDGCRIGSDTITTNGYGDKGFVAQEGYEPTSHEGRFPANIILDETAAELLDEQSGISKPSKGRTGIKGGSPIHQSKMSVDVEGHWPGDNGGGASRFFYVAKVSKKERNLGLDSFEDKEGKSNISGLDDKPRLDGTIRETPIHKNNHPTLKPINLMTYLCRLVTPQGGIVLDPFMGSGSTGIAALLEGFRFVGMEMDKDYFKIAEARIESYEQYRDLLK